MIDDATGQVKASAGWFVRPGVMVRPPLLDVAQMGADDPFAAAVTGCGRMSKPPRVLSELHSCRRCQWQSSRHTPGFQFAVRRAEDQSAIVHPGEPVDVHGLEIGHCSRLLSGMTTRFTRPFTGATAASLRRRATWPSVSSGASGRNSLTGISAAVLWRQRLALVAPAHNECAGDQRSDA